MRAQDLLDRFRETIDRVRDAVATSEVWQSFGLGYRKMDRGIRAYTPDEAPSYGELRGRVETAIADAFRDWEGPNKTYDDIWGKVARQGLPFTDWDDFRDSLKKQGVDYVVKSTPQGYDSGYLRVLDDAAAGFTVHAPSVAGETLSHRNLARHQKLMGLPNSHGFGASLRDYQNAPTADRDPLAYRVQVGYEDQRVHDFRRRMAAAGPQVTDRAAPEVLQQSGILKDIRNQAQRYKATKDPGVLENLRNLQEQAWFAFETDLRENYGLAYDVGRNGASYLRDLNGSDRAFASQVDPVLRHENVAALIGISFDAYQERQAERHAAAAPSVGGPVPADVLAAAPAGPDASVAAAPPTAGGGGGLDPSDIVLSQAPDGGIAVFQRDGRGDLAEIPGGADQLQAGQAYKMDDGRTLTLQPDGQMAIDGKPVATPTPDGLDLGGELHSYDAVRLAIGQNDTSVMLDRGGGNFVTLAMDVRELPADRSFLDLAGNRVQPHASAPAETNDPFAPKVH